MSLFEKKNDALDRAVSQIQAEDVDPAVIEQAAARVWERLSHAVAEPHAELQSSVAEPPPAAEAPHTLRLRGLPGADPGLSAGRAATGARPARRRPHPQLRAVPPGAARSPRG